VRLPCQAQRTSITMLSGRTLAPGAASALDSAATGQWPAAAPFWRASKPSGHTRGPCPQHGPVLECDANMRAGAALPAHGASVSLYPLPGALLCCRRVTHGANSLLTVNA